MYSQVPNQRGGPNNQGGWKNIRNLINGGSEFQKRLKVGDWSKWVLRIVHYLVNKLLCLDVDFYSISVRHFEV